MYGIQNYNILIGLEMLPYLWGMLPLAASASCEMEYYYKIYLTALLQKSNEKIDGMKNCFIKVKELEEL